MLKYLRCKCALLLLISSGTSSVLGAGFEVSPLVHEMTDRGLGASSKIQIYNPTDSILPLEVEVKRILFDSSGKQSIYLEDNELMVFPPALLIASGATQMLRLQWVGETEIEESRSYFVSLSQAVLPLAGGNTNAVRLMLTFNVLVHIAHEGSISDLEVLSTEIIKTDVGSVLQAKIKNFGPRYTYLSNSGLKLASVAGFSQHIPPGELRDLGKDVFIPPSVTRKVQIPLQGVKLDLSGPIHLEVIPDKN